jgi:hypothetical protein
MITTLVLDLSLVSMISDNGSGAVSLKTVVIENPGARKTKPMHRWAEWECPSRDLR